jgi:arginase
MYTYAIAEGLVPITLGGDHHITNPLVRAVAAHAQQPISIVHFDAHNDLYEDYEGDPYSHASPFARILERGPQECAKLVQLGIRTATTHNREQVKK